MAVLYLIISCVYILALTPEIITHFKVMKVKIFSAEHILGLHEGLSLIIAVPIYFMMRITKCTIILLHR